MAASTTRIIAIEEHFIDRAFVAVPGAGMPGMSPALADRLADIVGQRVAEMDAAGIDVQVLSHQSPGSQRLAPDDAVAACVGVNDRLAGAIAQAPDRFAGFAMLPTTAGADAAADELQRAVEECGLKGGMIHGQSAGRFIDTPEFWPIFARAEAMGVPIYLHPSLPDKAVIAAYYATYAESHPALIRAAWGFGIETGTQAVRLILSGLFDTHPDVQVILGHLGESIPFQLARIDKSLQREGNTPIRFSETFRNNFHVTTSGFFSDPALRCCIEELGVERIMFAVDWPYIRNDDGTNWMRDFALEPAEKARILGGNAEALLKL